MSTMVPLSGSTNLAAIVKDTGRIRGRNVTSAATIYWVTDANIWLQVINECSIPRERTEFRA